MAKPVLNRSLILENPARVPDGQGGYTETWSPLGTLWAEVTPRSGRAASGIEISLSRVGFRITVRAAPQGAPSRPRPGQRFVDGDRIFRIDAVTEARKGTQFLECYAQEEVAQ